MSKGIIAAIVCGVLGLSLVIYVAAKYNSFVSHENGIVASHEDLKNVHTSIFNDLKSQGLAIEKYGDMVIKAINAAIGGRYGDGGSRAAISALHEQNPTIDSALFQKLQVVIEAGYSRFESAQRSKIDRLRVYDNERESLGGNIVAGLFGFPRKVTDDMRATISSTETKEMMQTKEMKTVDPFAK